MKGTIVRKMVEQLILNALRESVRSGELSLEEPYEVSVERPKDINHGDWASNIALRYAKQAGKNPRELAELIASFIKKNEAIEHVEVAGPGFINIRLSQTALQSIFRSVRTQGRTYGRSDIAAGQTVDLEFVSANPTGPMHIGHGRWAALGDAMANVIEFCGYKVTREFYINDAGHQMDIFAISVAVRYLQIADLVATAQAGTGKAAAEIIVQNMNAYKSQLPQDCYAGAYIVDIAGMIYDSEGDCWVDAPADEREAHFKKVAYNTELSHVKQVLHDFGLEFDVWYSERSTYELDEHGTSRLSRTLDALDERGYLYQKDDATWFRTTDFDDDKDRVLIKADGSYTYFAPDIAYHKNKFDRGFDRCIDLLGADHHGYIKRIQSAGSVFGHPGQPEVVIGQLVNLFRDGKPVRMSKRTGEMVSFEELLDEVGVDATRFLMLSRSTDQPIDFDIEQAKKKDSSNPVYYVQYAHARICSLMRRASNAPADADIDTLVEALIPPDADLNMLVDESELALARKIDEFEELVAGCARDLAPFRLTHYAQELAAAFHHFYTQCQVISEDEKLTTARLYVCDATRRVIAQALGLLGVSAPSSM